MSRFYLCLHQCDTWCPGSCCVSVEGAHIKESSADRARSCVGSHLYRVCRCWMRLGAMLRLAVRSHQGASYASTHGISAQPPAGQLATLRLPLAGRPIPARTVGGIHLGCAAQVSRSFATRLVGRVAVRAGAVAASSGEIGKRKVVFLGTPQVSGSIISAVVAAVLRKVPKR
jgi:hypothetical protein